MAAAAVAPAISLTSTASSSPVSSSLSPTTRPVLQKMDELAQPRARKPLNGSQVERAIKAGLESSSAATSSSDSAISKAAYKNRIHTLTADLQRERAGSVPPSDDAPPSVKATSAARQDNRKKTRRMFPTVEFEPRVSYFDPQSDYSNFRGFFVLFWVGLAIMVITQMLRNIKETGTLLNFKQWPLFRKDMEELAVSDLLMCASVTMTLPLHRLYKSGPAALRWAQGGMYVQSGFQLAWLGLWIIWPFVRDWSWTAQVFFTLHTLTMFMKLHSYAFYNGHLATTLDRLKQLDLPIGPATPTNAAVRYPIPRTHVVDLTGQQINDPISSDATAADAQPAGNISPIMQLREDLAHEITSPMGNVTYPANLTFPNIIDFLMVPTLCYELEYPRRKSRSYLELFWKGLAIFGCVFLMIVTSEEFIIPVLDENQLRLAVSPSLTDSALIFAETVSRLLFPFMVTFLLVFLVIFEYVLGFFAEITRFADRQFYSDWWNSSDWLEFSREWNIPVHEFLRRHVYGASRGARFSRTAATGLTFLISALAHELIMGCITRKFRGYGFVLMMMQMPLVAIQRLPVVRKQKLLNNVMFWIFMVLGLSLLCALYVLL